MMQCSGGIGDLQSQGKVNESRNRALEDADRRTVKRACLGGLSYSDKT